MTAFPLNTRGQNLIYCFAYFPSCFLSASWEDLQTFSFQVYALVCSFPMYKRLAVSLVISDKHAENCTLDVLIWWSSHEALFDQCHDKNTVEFSFFLWKHQAESFMGKQLSHSFLLWECSHTSVVEVHITLVPNSS